MKRRRPPPLLLPRRGFTSAPAGARWGLTPAYANYLPFGRLAALHDASAFGVLDWPHWQSPETRKPLRALCDEHSTPRDLYIVDQVCGTLHRAASSSGGGEEEGSAAAASGVVEEEGGEQAGRKRNTHKGRSRKAPSVGTVAEEAASTLTGLSSPQPSYAELATSGSSPSIRTFLVSARDVFTALFGRGLPHFHRPLNVSLDSVVVHEGLLGAWKESAGREKASAAASLEVVPLRSKVVDVYSVWDGTGIGAPRGTGRRTGAGRADVEGWGRTRAEEEDGEGDVIEASEAGHSIVMRRHPSTLPLALRVASEYFHYYKLQPPRRVATQVTVAYECREMVVTAHAEGSAGGAAWRDTVHTVTYESELAFPFPAPGGLRGLLGNLARYAQPMALMAPVSGWRVTDVDGWMARHHGPTHSCTFVPWFEEARALALRQSAAQEGDMIEGHAYQTKDAQVIPPIAKAEGEAVFTLRATLARTPAGRGVLLSVAEAAAVEEAGEEEEPGVKVDASTAGGTGGAERVPPKADATAGEGSRVGDDAAELGSAAKRKRLEDASPLSDALHIAEKPVGTHGKASMNGAKLAAHKRAMLELQGSQVRVDGLLALQAAGLTKAAASLTTMLPSRAGPPTAPWVLRLREDEKVERELQRMPESERLYRLTGLPAASSGVQKGSAGGAVVEEAAGGSRPLSQLTPGPWPVRPDPAFRASVESMDGDATLQSLLHVLQPQMGTWLMQTMRTRLAGIAGYSAVRVLDCKTSSFLASAGGMMVVEDMCTHLERYVSASAVRHAQPSLTPAEAEGEAKELADMLATLHEVAKTGVTVVRAGSMKAEWAEIRGSSDEEEEEGEVGAGTPHSATPVSASTAIAAARTAMEEPSDEASPSAIRQEVHSRVMAAHTAAVALLSHLEARNLLAQRRREDGTVWREGEAEIVEPEAST